MSKRAKEAAMNAYPLPNFAGMIGNDASIIASQSTFKAREYYIEGYEQGEKDYIELAQLWVDSGDANIMSFEQFLKCHETQSNK